MSFDIFFQPCRFGGKPVTKQNPFTGKGESLVPNEPLTPAEVKAVRAVLKRASAEGPDEFGYFVVETADGGGAEVSGDHLSESCMVSIRGLTPGLLTFLMDLLTAGTWVMLPAMEGNIAITTSPDHVKGVPEDFPEVVTCTSAEDLGILLSGGLKAWKKYRDQVVREVPKDKKRRK